MGQKMHDRWGSRGAVLALLGVLWVTIGLQTALTQPGVPYDPDTAILHHWLPLWVRVVLWVGSGVVAIVTAATGRGEAVGWSALWIMPVVRTVSYGWSALMWMVPGAPGGAPDSLWLALQWAATGAILIVVSRWPEDSAARRRRTATALR